MLTIRSFFHIVISILGLLSLLVSKVQAFEHTEVPVDASIDYTTAAPILRPVSNVSINPLHLNEKYSEDHGFTIAELLNHIERMNHGRQFSSMASNFSFQNVNLGIAILSIDYPIEVSPLVSIGGNNGFYYPISSPRYPDLARLIEPHQRLSFRSPLDTYEVKIRFRLWDLRERNQITSFQEYRIDKTGGVSGYSDGVQEVTFKISTKKNKTTPYWSKNDPVLKKFEVKNSRHVLIKVRDLLIDNYGEYVLRDEDNDPLGIKLKSINLPEITVYYRYSIGSNWHEFVDANAAAYLPINAEIYISHSGSDYKNHYLSLTFQGWDGRTQYQNFSTTQETRAVDIQYK